MAIPSRPIGQDPQSQILWYIAKELERLQKIVSSGSGSGGPVTIVNGGDVAQGSTTDDKNGSTDVTPATQTGILKYLSYLWQSVWSAANTARTNATKVITVQQVDPNGYTPQLTSLGEQKVMTNAHSYIPATHWSPTDGNCTYLSSSTLTCTGWAFTVDSNSAIRSIGVTSSANVMTLYENGVGGISIYAAGNVITILKDGVAFAAFAATDLGYKVAIGQYPKTIDNTLDVQKTVDQAPDRASYVLDSLLDTTNLAAATNYLPASTGMSMDGFKDLSITGKFIDADGQFTMTVEATNDEDAATATWVQVYAYDSKNNAMVNSWTVTNGTLTFAIDLDNLNYSLFRVIVINNGATNTAEVKIRRKSL